MLEANTLQFLKELQKNNDRVWFDAHRDTYQIAMKDMQSFTTRLLHELVAIDPSIEGL